MAPTLELPARALNTTRSADVSVEYSANNAVEYPGDHDDDLIEEPMDYTPMSEGSVAAPDHPAEEWPEGSGPAGF